MLKEHKLKNGLTLITQKLDTSYSTNIGIFIKAGTQNELKDNYGCAHFLEHMLFKGTHKRTSVEIAEAIDGVGGLINAYTSHEYTGYYTRSLPEDALLSLDVLYDMITGSLFDPIEIEKEKKVILEEINMYEDDPNSFIVEEFTKHLYEGSPLGYNILGEKKLLRQVNREILMEYLETWYQPENMIMVIAGKIDKELVGMAERTFGSIRRNDKLSPEPIQDSQPKVFPIRIYERADVNQVYFIIGQESVGRTHPDYYRAVLLDTIVGASPSSYLFQQVREKLSLCYDISSYTSAFRNTGEFVIAGGANQENFPLALQEIHAILSKIREDGVTEIEFNRAKKQFKSRLVMTAESSKNIMFKTATAYVYFGRYSGVDDAIREVEEIGYHEFNEFVRGFIRLDRLNVCLLGPKGTKKMKKVWEEINGKSKG